MIKYYCVLRENRKQKLQRISSIIVVGAHIIMEMVWFLVECEGRRERSVELERVVQKRSVAYSGEARHVHSSTVCGWRHIELLLFF